MLYVSDAGTTSQPVLKLRLSASPSQDIPYRAALAEHGLDLVECSTLEAAQEMVREGCRVGLLIVTQESELNRLERWEAVVSNSRVCWVALVAQDLIGKPRMREFIGEHLFNFITLPAELDHIVLTLRHAWGMAFMREVQHHPSPAKPGGAPDEAIVGNSPQTQQLLEQIQKVASTDASVLICGPSGSGKELAALAIHRQSARSQGPFVAINCGAIPAQHFHAVLFGCQAPDTGDGDQQHTGRIGRVEAAQGGTLFLDAVDSLPLDIQASLLQHLSDKMIGCQQLNQSTPVDVRVIAATHADLPDLIRQGRFRDDLYYRLNVMCLTMPRLADRGRDIEAIALHYFTKFAKTHNRSLRGFSKAAMNALLTHSWPGNVRELINRVQRATVMAEGRFIQPEELGLERSQPHAELMSLEDARAAAERTMIRRALAQSRNQISRAASLLGVSRVTLYRLIEKYNIRPEGASSIRASLLTGSKPEAKIEVHK